MKTEKLMLRQRLWSIGSAAWPWYVVGAVLFLSFGYTEMAGSDLWWHVAGGREILQQGTLWLQDDWSYSAEGQRWRNHEWLSDVIFYAWQQLFGLQSLVYWKWLVVVASYGLLQGLLVRLAGDHLAALLLSAMALMVAAPFIDLRPHLYSLLGVVLLCHLQQREAPFWQFALLFVVWVNLHGGFIFGLLILPALLFPYRHCSRLALRRAVLVVLGCVAVTLLNPDGVKVVLMPLTYALQADSPFRQIAEWLPPWTPGGIRSPLFVWLVPVLPLALLVSCVPAVRRARPLPWWALAMSILTLAMALTSRRFIPLFGISLALFVAPLLGLAMRRAGAARWHAPLLLALLLLGLARLWSYPLRAAPAFHYLTAEYTYPRYMVDMMQANTLQGRVFAYYNWGGYLHWRSDGNLRVYIDGRANTVFDDTTYLNYVRVLQGAPGWLDIVENSGAEMFLWPLNRGSGLDKASAMINSGRWRLVYRSARALLLARVEKELPQPLMPGPESVYRELERAQLAYARGHYDAAAAAAASVLQQVPFQRDGCNVKIAALQSLGDGAGAAEARLRCRRQFPSAYLR